MQRKQTPANQVELIDAFIRSSGAQAKRADLLELVARLNGAANWNELERPARENAFSRKMRQVLAPWAERFGLTKQMREFVPAAHNKPNEAVLQALYQVVVPHRNEDSERAAMSKACIDLDTLAETAREVAHQLRKELGYDREVPEPEGVSVYTMRTVMLDDDSPWTIVLDGDEIEIPQNLFEELLKVGVVGEAKVEYPRGDRYGVPEEATDEGCKEFLWGQGFALSTTFEAFGEDTGDDSMATCELGIYIPEELIARIRAGE